MAIITKPQNYPNSPRVGKISLLFNKNKHKLWHEFSPYTTGDGIFGILKNQQPFIYRFPDEGGKTVIDKLPTALKTLASIGGITKDSLDDVVRVSKFSVSSPAGILYNLKQFAIQRSQPFDETRLYNPLSPVLATVSSLTFGIGQKPIRHVEGGLLGFANSITSTVGINLDVPNSAPKSTVGDEALPILNRGQGKGLIRGGTATDAYAEMQKRVGGSTSQSSLLSAMGNALKSFFGGASKSPGPIRADQHYFDLKYNGKDKFFMQGGLGQAYSMFHPWYFGKQSFRGREETNTIYRLMPLPQSVFLGIVTPTPGLCKVDEVAKRFKVNGKDVGWVHPTTTDYPQWWENSSVFRYSSVIHPTDDEVYTNSSILLNYAYYITPDLNYLSKVADPLSDTVVKINESLKKMITGLESSGVYEVLGNTDSRLLNPGRNSDVIGYDKIAKIDSKNKQKNDYGVGVNYYANTFSIPVDSHFGGRNLRIATTFKSDGLNQLGVLNKNKKIKQTQLLKNSYSNWEKYNPYYDDLIAFLFYDVVNEKYIPFRATVKGISEGNTAFWDELKFIGRADQLYSYNGFSRTLSFTYNVVINSVSELLPTWQKINYMASSVKPSNYTSGASYTDNRYSKFMVPPMFTLTIGDMYKQQPIVITSVTVNIPDDASWETLNEDNSTSWSYLARSIVSEDLGKNYAQLPKEAEIAITCNVLEKERAMIGGSHFGHAPNGETNNVTEFHKNMMVRNKINT